MKVKIYGEIYECDKAVKGKDFVKLYDADGNVTAEFRGIKDFAGYEVVEGVWSLPKKTDKEKIDELDNIAVTLDESNILLFEENKALKNSQAEQDEAIILLYEKGGI